MEIRRCFISSLKKAFPYEEQVVFCSFTEQDKYYDLMHYSWSFCVDKDDGYKWVQGHVNGDTLPLSRYVMNYDGDLMIDHKNGDTLDNRVSNLRIATSKQNAMNIKIRKNNTSGCTGVRCLKNGKYSARIKRINLGTFSSKDEAIKARKEAEVKYSEEWARGSN
jgi:HNH endonuclease